MPAEISEYGLIGDMRTSALVSRRGSIDWFCAPRFDSGACFASLLGREEHGFWKIGAKGADAERPVVERRYVENTMVLQTDWTVPGGRLRVTDFMPVSSGESTPSIVRIAEALDGEMQVEMVLRPVFDYGSTDAWITRTSYGAKAVAGPNGLVLQTLLPLREREGELSAQITLKAGERVETTLSWFDPGTGEVSLSQPQEALEATLGYWQRWSEKARLPQKWGGEVMRSLLTMKALTYRKTGGVVAAATASLPEEIGGSRNWDYRLCWTRDASWTLAAFLHCGYTEEACGWRDWLLRALAGNPRKLQNLYGLAGERLLWEHELDWLPGYENSAPVRIGNAAHRQRQLDVYGEMMRTLRLYGRFEIEPTQEAVELQRALLGALTDRWHLPDEGLWEVRGQKQHFTHSKVMAWAAFDAAQSLADVEDLPDAGTDWRRTAETIRAEVCENAFDARRNAFVQHYGATSLDAALLKIPEVGFLPPDDPRVAGTVDAVQRELMRDGFVHRYDTAQTRDGLPSGERAFLACSFWLSDALVGLGRLDEAHEMFERALSASNDLGLMSEEYDPVRRQQLGNFPQALSHISLINSARKLSDASSG
ncbi:Trehalase [Jannaschia seosinensis]|uniref:Trehalase n=1 Tax=Jannaschia seosinensis TaxID=313367 RepID=A0A0M7BBB0_9RHOB|nr:glycoside hydrolase family 15 protein [Jannaschia seosinensis]CUH37939.1 Trehalase [Jannaschia seosinensis]